MINEPVAIFLYLKDYAENGDDRFFLYQEGSEDGNEVSAAALRDFAGTLVCHDYWLIAPAIFELAAGLPENVIDIEEFSIAITGFRNDRKERDRKGIVRKLATSLRDGTIPNRYLEIFNKTAPFDEQAYAAFAGCLLGYWRQLIREAEEADELNRQFFVEIPVFNLLYKHVVRGIGIDQDILREHKKEISHQYYLALKNFSAKHNLPLEVPSDKAIAEHLAPQGFDFSAVSVEAVLQFLSIPSQFGADVLHLRRLDASRTILNALPVSRKIAIPIIDVFGSITSRIYFKNPVFQNLARQYRNIIIPEKSSVLSYVDYDQFEVGIMAALSGDPSMLHLYTSTDIYKTLSEDIFGTEDKRKEAKRFFLSYAYGMKIKFLVDAAVEHGADRGRVKKFFAQFEVFERWKKAVMDKFEAEGKIGTQIGNYQRREADGKLTEKEKRSCVNQVVQGTASLIFKKALLKLKDEPVRILVPMHDAVLVEHKPDYPGEKLVAIFSSAMTEHFSGTIKGKASLELFYKEAT